MTTLGATAPPEVSSNYTIATSADNSATPPTFSGDRDADQRLNQAAKDTKCATLTLSSAGAKSISGSGSVQDCW